MIKKYIKNQILISFIPLSLLLFYTSYCNTKETEAERTQRIQMKYKNQIKTEYTIPHSSPNRIEAVTTFLNQVSNGEPLNSLCDEKESKEILFPNSYNSNSLISFEEPDRAFEIVRGRQEIGLQSLQAKLKGTTISDLRIEWRKEIRDLNALKGHVVQNILIKTRTGELEINEIKLVIEHRNQFKVCVVSK